jgi:hypothetical protein
MRKLAALALALALPWPGASAAHLSVEFSGSLGGGFHAEFSGFGGRHRFETGFAPGFLGMGLLVPDFAEAVQMRFEDRFADIVAEYDDGVANIEDYYSTDDYEDVVDDTERLVDRYDWFVTGVERSIEHLDSFIDLANDKLTFLEELLADYQARDDLSETRLERIEDWITTLQDHTQLKIDLLTERQTTLTESLPTYQDFQSQITTYLDDIVAAGSGSGGDDSGESASALRSLAANVACDDARQPAGAIPEPHGLALAGIAALAALRRPRRG